MSAAAPARPAAPGAEEILAALNDEQRLAVTHGEGPLLIVAGAGTGKTQVLTRRIAWLIATKRARPEQILALTFTEKAAAEMEARVDQLVPYGLVGATIATFNAFCDRVVREHAIELGITSRLRVESEAEILVFLRDRLFDLGLERYLPLGHPESHLRALHQLFDRARNEDVSPARYQAFAESLRAAAGDDAEKRDRAAAEVEKARAYARFTEKLLAAGRVDFGSQIGLALRLLRERAHVRRLFQDRFRWILVDEFQDTNHVQLELIRTLAAPPFNVTIVGDDDQSIYRFRGAKVENLLEFLDAFPGAREILLRLNYRSGQGILDCAHRLIRHNDPARLEVQRGIDKRLIAERRGADGAVFAGTVEHRAFPGANDQCDTVASEIATALAAGAGPGDFAILARAHNHLDPFALALRARGVPFRRVGLQGLYTRPEIQLCLNVLHTLADPDDGASVYMALDHPLFGADPVDLARLAATARGRHRPLLLAAQEAIATGEEMTDATRGAVKKFAVLHHQLAALAASSATSEVLYALVSESGLLTQLSSVDSAENLEALQNLQKLFGITQRVGKLLTHDRVAEFVPHLDLLRDFGDDPAAVEVETDQPAVQLLTAHGAKGLEFPVVYLVDLVEQRFPQYAKGDPLPFPRELMHAAGDEKSDHEREERRLFYVAMTRARDRLVLCHARDLGGRRLAKPSRFVLEALDLPAAPRGARQTASALETIERYAPVPDPPAPGLPVVREDQPIAITHSKIATFLHCPLRYWYTHVARVPVPASPARMYGTAIHRAIAVWHQHRLRRFPIEVADVIAAYERDWSSEGFLTLAHEERMFAQGRETLERFVRNDLAAPATTLAVETDFEFRVGIDRATGRWDRIDELPDGKIALIDYKTAQVEDAEAATARAEQEAGNGQLGLYALAYRETRAVVPARVELRFVGSGTIGAVDVEPEHLERAAERIRATADGIRAGSFEPKPDPRGCAHCDFRQICRFSAARR